MIPMIGMWAVCLESGEVALNKEIGMTFEKRSIASFLMNT